MNYTKKNAKSNKPFTLNKYVRVQPNLCSYLPKYTFTENFFSVNTHYKRF